MAWLLDFRWIKESAIKAPWDVMCKLTMSPSLIEEHLVFSWLKFYESMD